MKWSQHNAKRKVSPTTQVAKGIFEFAFAIAVFTPAILQSYTVYTEDTGITDVRHKWTTQDLSLFPPDYHATYAQASILVKESYVLAQTQGHLISLTN